LLLGGYRWAVIATGDGVGDRPAIWHLIAKFLKHLKEPADGQPNDVVVAAFPIGGGPEISVLHGVSPGFVPGHPGGDGCLDLLVRQVSE
jgi:hypothetical protein